MKKRILSILLALSMLLTLVPSAFADGVSEGTVATIGEAEFTSLKDAINAAQPDDIVKLFDNYSNYRAIQIGKSITLDLNGYNIERTFGGIAVDITAGDVVITGNGKISGSADGVRVDDDATLTLEEGVIVEGRDGHGIYTEGKLTIDGATITATEYGVALYSGDEWAASLEMLDGSVSGACGVAAYAKTDVTVKGGTISGTVAGLSGEGGSHDTTFNIEGGTIQSEDGVGIYHPQNGKLNISGGTVIGATGINMKSGELNITGGTIKGNGEKADYSFVGGGFNSTGDALVIESCGYPGGAPKATITGGTFESENATAVASYAGNNVTETVTDFVSGGTYSDNSAESHLADGYALKLNGDGTYGLIEATPEEIEEKATATFNVTPADAVVKVEKGGVEFVGTDNVYELLGGTYNYTVSKDGYYTVSGSFTVAGEDLPVNVTMTKIAYYTVTYTDGVDDAEIFADQSFTVAENTATPVFEGTIAREGYTFKGWTPAVAATVTADATYVAVFEKIPEEPKDPVFEDVSADAYYADAVIWAAKNKVTTGVEEGVFAPEVMCTRAQVVTFLWRAAGEPKTSADTEVFFADIEEGSYYYDAVVWAVENGITNGVSATEFAPDAVCTRAQVVTFLWRAAGEPKAEAEMSSDDVAEGTYYYDAVLWAAENKITNGVSATEFAPANESTRAQAITLLYRAFN
ncbi:MAG: S-layer homology domain-containing protein [Clostridia bacterium]|nr:S-layer homology domain-containing protein [Clostridia bacterium]